MISFFLGMIAGAFALKAYQYSTEDECPRMIRGYNCKGKVCDHSPASIAEAKWDMRRR